MGDATEGGLLPTDWDQWKAITKDALKVDGLVSGDREIHSAEFPGWLKKENQGPINSCAANAGTSCVEGASYLANGSTNQLSRWYAYIEGTKACGMFPADAGCTLDGIAKALMTKGVPLEATVPYPAQGYDRSRTSFSAAVHAEAALRRMKKTVDLSAGYDAWAKTLGQGIGLILLGVHWPFATTIRNGVKYANRYRPIGRGGHALCGATLADTRDASGRRDVFIGNSHLGDEVYLVSAQWIDDLQQADPFGNIGLTDLTEPVPRRLDWLRADSPFK